jgi:hypothetical protein
LVNPPLPPAERDRLSQEEIFKTDLSKRHWGQNRGLERSRRMNPRLVGAGSRLVGTSCATVLISRIDRIFVEGILFAVNVAIFLYIVRRIHAGQFIEMLTEVLLVRNIILTAQQ